MSKISATIVADSINPQGDRLTSLLITFPRILLSEVNTHRMLSKNTSSSRAIPFNKMVEAVQNNPFIPIAFQKSHSGMQGTEYLTRLDYDQAKFEWLEAKDRAIEQAQQLDKIGTTKQLCNRLLEPFMWTTMLITGSREGWENFFNLRNPSYEIENYNNQKIIFKSKKEIIKFYNEGKMFTTFPSSDLQWLLLNKGQAEIHMMALAECIWDAVNESIPKQLKAGEWHIPFEKTMNQMLLSSNYYENTKLENWYKYKVKISTAMAAHTSYTTVGNEPVKSYEKWIELHDKLIAYDPPHSSPMEHCARVMSDKEYESFYKGSNRSCVTKDIGDGWCYNLKGFIPLRYFIDNSIKY